jgi:hypothetical protein
MSKLFEFELQEGAETFTHIARRCPPIAGKAISRMSVSKWASRGIKCSGEVVKLEAVRFAGRWVTTNGALQRFLKRVREASGS